MIRSTWSRSLVTVDWLVVLGVLSLMVRLQNPSLVLVIGDPIRLSFTSGRDGCGGQAGPCGIPRRTQGPIPFTRTAVEVAARILPGPLTFGGAHLRLKMRTKTKSSTVSSGPLGCGCLPLFKHTLMDRHWGGPSYMQLAHLLVTLWLVPPSGLLYKEQAWVSC